MLVIKFLFALVILFLITAIFAVVLRRRGAWPFLLLFFSILLGTWAGGIWLTPRGPNSMECFLGAVSNCGINFCVDADINYSTSKLSHKNPKTKKSG